MERLIPGADCWWAVGTHRVARLPLDAMDARGRLQPEAASVLASAGLCQPADSDLYHVTVLITTRCNLGCSYCFQNTDLPESGPAGPSVRVPSLVLDDAATDRIMAFTRRQMTARGASKLDLVLFGGEPAMYPRACLGLLAAASELGLVRAAMYSNGTLLTPRVAGDFARAGLHQVQVTLDGDQPAHDTYRRTLGGRRTFHRILDNLAAVSAATDLQLTLRVNLTRESIGDAPALVRRLTDRLEPARFGLYFSLVFDPGIGFGESLQPSVALAQRVGGLYRQAVAAGFSVPSPRITPCLACGTFAGETGAVVNADGTLYSCWESAGKQGYDVGTVTDGYLPDEQIRPRWVACGYSSSAPPSGAQRFQDALDGILLDLQYDLGRLASAGAR
jgi:uncharacterized protein